MDVKNLEACKPVLSNLIKFYYESNAHGGLLNNILDKGNVAAGQIWYAQEIAKEAGDSLAYFIATLMREFTEPELQGMYDRDFWGMDK